MKGCGVRGSVEVVQVKSDGRRKLNWRKLCVALVTVRGRGGARAPFMNGPKDLNFKFFLLSVLRDYFLNFFRAL